MRSRVFGALMLLALPVFAADYNGTNIDGTPYDCTAFSYSTSKFYEGTCEFDGSEVTFTFSSNGREITLEMDDEEIDDPSSISTFDYKKSTFWDLDVDIDD